MTAHAETEKHLSDLPRLGAVAVLRVYKKLISPLLPQACRFHPTCADYATEVVRRYGVLRGGWLALRRLARCHPFTTGGFDPAP